MKYYIILIVSLFLVSCSGDKKTNECDTLTRLMEDLNSNGSKYVLENYFNENSLTPEQLEKYADVLENSKKSFDRNALNCYTLNNIDEYVIEISGHKTFFKLETNESGEIIVQSCLPLLKAGEIVMWL